jgi:toxin ParE1/3/4
MTRRLILRPEADAELTDAMEYYEERRRGLGDEFFFAVDDALTAIRHRAESFPAVHGDVRRALLRRFPYGVYYFVEGDAVVVIAIFHGKRNPKRWQDRR